MRSPIKPRRVAKVRVPASLKGARPPFEICGASVTPGTRTDISLTVPNLSTYTPMHMPIHVIHGATAGPTLLVCAAIHGDEINGVEVIRRLLAHRPYRRLRGTLIAAPIVNVYGFLTHTRYLPDGRDLNRSFPGREHGSLAGRLAQVFLREIVDHCTYAVDLHTGSRHRYNYPHIRANLDDEETLRLAQTFGASVMVHAHSRDGSLRQIATERNIKFLLYEAGEALRFDPRAVTVGLRGILNVMRMIGMLPVHQVSTPDRAPIRANTSTWVRAPRSGIFSMNVHFGDAVEIDQELGIIADPLGRNAETIRAPVSGIVIGRTQLPVVNEGDALYHLARIKDTERAAETLLAFDDDLDADDTF